MTGDDKIVEPPISEEALRRNEAAWRSATMLIRAVGVSPPDGPEAWKAGVRQLYHKVMLEGPGAALGVTQTLREVAKQRYLDFEMDDAVVWARMLSATLDLEDPKAVIKELKAERRAANRPIPPHLANADEALDRGEYDSRPKRGAPSADPRRNAAIWICFLALKLYGFQEMRSQSPRNPSTVPESACSVVARIARMEEEAVHKVVGKWKKLAGVGKNSPT